MEGSLNLPMYLLEVSVPEATVKGDCTVSFGSQTSIIEVPYRHKLSFKHPEPQKIRLHLTFSSLSNEVHRFEIPVRNFFVQGSLDEWFSIDAGPMESPVRRRNFYDEEYLQASTSTRGSSPDKKGGRKFRLVCTVKKQESTETVECIKCRQFEKLLESMQSENETLKANRLRPIRGERLAMNEIEEYRTQAVDHASWSQELELLKQQLKESQLKRLELQALLDESNAKSQSTVELYTKEIGRLSEELRTAQSTSRGSSETALADNRTLQAELNSLRAELSAQKLKATNFTNVKAALERAKNSLSYADDQVKKLTTEFRSKTTEFKAIEEEWERIKNELLEERRGLRERLDQLVLKLRNKSDESEAYRIEVTKLRARLAELELNVGMSGMRIEYGERLEQKAKELEDKNDSLAQSMRETEDEYQTATGQLKQQLALIDRDRKLLEAKAERASEAVRQSEAEMAKLRAESIKQSSMAGIQSLDSAVTKDRESLVEQLKVYDQLAQSVRTDLVQQVEVLTDELILQTDKADQAQRKVLDLQKKSERSDSVKRERGRKSRYEPSKNDPIDSAMADIANRYSDLPVGFKREESGVYLFGTRKVIVKMEQGRLIVRVGGGFMNIEEFVEIYTPLEVEKLSDSMDLARSSSVEKFRAHLVHRLNEGWNPCIGVNRRSPSPSPLRN
mmetsp:Transcript_9794/g.19231  ORF Transcript_9794/g.19231 Transcript_9794/m.19231 type:complete len:678 (+) Transcript_9794:492-2525(+)